MNKQLVIERNLNAINEHKILTEEVRELLVPDSNAVFLFDEKSFEQVQVISCDYTLEQKQDLLIDVHNDALKMHFRLSGESTCYCSEGGTFGLQSGEHSLMFHNNCETNVVMQPTPTRGKFIEIMISRSLFERYFEEGNDFQKRFLEQANTKAHVWTNRSLQITPEMFALLQEMQKDTYGGYLKKLFLEAKLTELMLLQVDAFDKAKTTNTVRYTTQELEKIHYVRTLIEQHIDNPLTIAQLSREVGLNTKKLTVGFKTIFQTTIFDYVKSYRMQEAKRLLLDCNWYVGEVATHLGYKNSQHFTVAFKKYHGVVPSLFKR